MKYFFIVSLLFIKGLQAKSIVLDSELNFDLNSKYKLNNKKHFLIYLNKNFEFIESNNFYFLSFQINKKNTPIFSIYKGTVILIDQKKKSISIKYEDTNDTVFIKYVGISYINVQENQIIKKGDLLGYTQEEQVDIRIKLNDFILNANSENINFINH